MSHFSLFCIEEYTIKQGSNWLSFSFKSTQWSSFGDYVVLLMSTFLSTSLAPLNGVYLASILTTFWRLWSSFTQFIMTFGVT